MKRTIDHRLKRLALDIRKASGEKTASHVFNREFDPHLDRVNKALGRLNDAVVARGLGDAYQAEVEQIMEDVGDLAAELEMYFDEQGI